VSGIEALVSASTEAQAEREWEAEVRKGFAEPMRAIRRPYPGEVREIARDGTHDYR